MLDEAEQVGIGARMPVLAQVAGNDHAIRLRIQRQDPLQRPVQPGRRLPGERPGADVGTAQVGDTHVAGRYRSRSRATGTTRSTHQASSAGSPVFDQPSCRKPPSSASSSCRSHQPTGSTPWAASARRYAVMVSSLLAGNRSSSRRGRT